MVIRGNLPDEPRPAGSFPTGHLTGGCASAAAGIYDVTAEAVSVWRLGRGQAGS